MSRAHGEAVRRQAATDCACVGSHSGLGDAVSFGTGELRLLDALGLVALVGVLGQADVSLATSPRHSAAATAPNAHREGRPTPLAANGLDPHHR